MRETLRLGVRAHAPERLNLWRRKETLQCVHQESAALIRFLGLVLALADHAYVLGRGQVSYAGPAEPLLTDLDFRKQVLWL